MLCECLIGAIVVATIWIAARLYMRSTIGVCRSSRDMSGKTVIITGANTGIGLETALDLASRNARVILACRDQEKGLNALQRITGTTGNNQVLLKKLDLCSLKSVRIFAEGILETEDRLDVLVNNAGAMIWKFQETEDGFESMMCTNHYGHFLLTNLLLPLLKRSAPSRVVVVSSWAHELISLNLNNMNGEKYFFYFVAYCRSKLANVLFMRELHTRLRGTGVSVNALQPGTINSELFRNVSFLEYLLVSIVLWPIFKTVKEGAQTTIYCCVSPELEGVSGKYFSDCKERKLWNHAKNEKIARDLWEHSEKVTGFHPEISGK